jgi:hypothetical protein
MFLIFSLLYMSFPFFLISVSPVLVLLNK